MYRFRGHFNRFGRRKFYLSLQSSENSTRKMPFFVHPYWEPFQGTEVLFPLHEVPMRHSTFKQRKNVRKNDPLLQHIHTIIPLLDDQHWIEEEHEDAEHYQLMGNLILRYERAMAERLDGDKAAALRLVDEVIEVLHLFPKDQRSIFTKRKSHFIHPLFTFKDPLVYVDFQHRLIRSSIGLPSIRNDEFSGIMDNILELKMEFEHAPRVSQKSCFSSSFFLSYGCAF